MPHYLLSAHMVEHETPAPPDDPMSEEAMQQAMQRLDKLERDMAESGVWVFSGRLHPPDAATVVCESNGDTMTTDGPFAESKEHLAGFYVIRADDLEVALSWAARVTACVNTPIEVRPFAGFTDQPGQPVHA